ncbi:hypothetical protein MIMGU_mgv1a018066mg, partial [Erythranthe guttata]
MASPPNNNPLHFVLIPLMAPGHIIPMIDMAKLLARRHVSVSILVTHLDATRFSPVIDRAVESGLSIQLIKIRFPCEEAGLPRGCESADTLPSYHFIGNFFNAIIMLQKPLEELISKELMNNNPSPVSCIISDKHITWTAATNALFISKVYERGPPDEPFLVPGLPDEIEFTRNQLPGLFNPGPLDVTGVREQVRETEKRAYGVVVNTFEEVEKRYVDEFKTLKNGKVWCVGPLSLSSKGDLDISQRGNQASIDTDQCLKWLDGKNPGSVIYSCLGSLSRLSPAQFVEFALGLEESNHPFIIVVKKSGSKSEEIENWIKEDGIEERTKERGLFIRGWAPQVMILSHASVGGFLTHCGWNSTLEGISAGLPMVTWPMFAEQFLNEKLIVRILNTGVGVGARGVVHLGGDEVKASSNKLVKRSEIKEAIWRVMEERESGCERRKRAKEFGEMANKSVEEG